MARGKAAFTGDVKALIYQRAKGRCDRCGLPTGDAMHFHHRTPRRAGGSSREDLGLPSNGLLLHPNCHDFIESRRKVAAQLGFIVGYGSLPNLTPVMLWNGWANLHDDGTLTMLPGPPPLRPVDGGVVEVDAGTTT